MENMNVPMTEAEVVEITVPETAEAATEATVAEAPVAEAVKVMLSPEDFEALKNGFKSYYDALLRAVKFAKQKDLTIAKITKELQKYREGFGKSLVKPIAISLISFFEDNRKTAREIEKYAKDKDSVLKYLDYTLSDMESILELYDIAYEDGEFTVKGKPLMLTDEYAEPVMPEITVPEEKADETVAFESEECSLAAALEFMKIGQARVEAAIADTAYLDANIESYTAVASTVDKNYTLAIMTPIYRKTAELYLLVKSQLEDAEARITDETYGEIYKDALDAIITATSDLLTYIGVEILEVIGDEYDPKTSKILKVIATDNPELDKKVAERHSECYSLDGAIIQPSRVSVYKFS